VSTRSTSKDASQHPDAENEVYVGLWDIRSLLKTPDVDCGSVPTLHLQGGDASAQLTPVEGDTTLSHRFDDVAPDSSPTTLATSSDMPVSDSFTLVDKTNAVPAPPVCDPSAVASVIDNFKVPAFNAV
jgi:hypothetical protein